jgi:hypothetical protein
VAGLTVAVLGGGLAYAGAGGYPASRPNLLSGSAWLPSPKVGQLTLLDGSSAEVAAQVQVAHGGDAYEVVQQSATAYVVNHTGGTIRRVDGATFEVSPPATPLPGAGTGLHAYAGPDALYALDSGRGVLAFADPATLVTRGPTVPLAAQVDGQAAVLDGSGRLWVLDGSTGDLVWIDHGTRHTRRGVARPGSLLVLANGTPVVVDLAARTAGVLDPGSGGTHTSFGLDLRSGDQVQVSGSPHSPRLYVVAGRGVLDICDLDATGCGSAVPLGSGELGPPVETGGRLFVPDYDSGRVWIVDLGDHRVVAQPQVLDPRTRFQLITRDGVVFFNDPDSERAGVIRLDGGVRPVAKYDPEDPGKGLTDQPGTDRQPPPVPSDGGSPDAASSPPSTPTPGRDTVGVRIVASTSAAQTGQDVTLKVVGTGRAVPKSARWSLGDGQAGTGLVVTHRWGTAQTYQISVTATFPDGRTATATLPMRVANRSPRLTVTVGGGGSVSGAGIACPPTCDTTTAPGAAVTLTATPAAGLVLTGWGGACSGTGATCTVTMSADRAVSATFGTPVPVVLPAPVLVSPANGAVLFAFPRTTTVTWRAVPGAARYHMEAEINDGTWVSASDQNVTGTSATFTFVGDNAGRWRVTAIAPDGSTGTTSAFRTFSYDTRIAVFAGNWHNVDPNTGGIRVLTFQATSPTSGRLHIEGACVPTNCNWGTVTATLSGGTLHGFFDTGRGLTEDVRITASGSQLTVKVHSAWSTGQTMDSTDSMVRD